MSAGRDVPWYRVPVDRVYRTTHRHDCTLYVARLAHVLVKVDLDLPLLVRSRLGTCIYYYCIRIVVQIVLDLDLVPNYSNI